MKELLEKEKAELEQRIKDNEKRLEELKKAIYWDNKRLRTNKSQMEALIKSESDAQS
jgi:uncharacterized coiled-coil protein SlyX